MYNLFGHGMIEKTRCHAFILGNLNRQCMTMAISGDIFCTNHESFIEGECLRCRYEDDPEARAANIEYIMRQVRKYSG